MPVELDHNATTRPAPEVIRAVTAALAEQWHNPSSVHRGGQEARRVVELARASVAALVNARPRDIVFTSGATESINLALRGAVQAARLARAQRGDHGPLAVITTPIEHEAAREALAGMNDNAAGRGSPPPIQVELRLLPLDEHGAVRAGAIDELFDDRVVLVNAQWANNETGAVQPVHELARICRARRVAFHCDATQWVGKMPTDLGAGGGAADEAGAGATTGGHSADSGGPMLADFVSFSAHKFHGPKGVGALFVRQGAKLAPQQRGVQERERRGGTENVPAIAGFGVAAELAARWLQDPGSRAGVAALRDRFEAKVLASVPHTSVNGPRTSDPARRLWNTTNIAFERLEAEALLLLLSERGVYASAGAACSSGSLDPSPVLLAMGIPAERAHGSVRFSLSRETTAEEVDAAADIVAQCAARLRRST